MLLKCPIPDMTNIPFLDIIFSPVQRKLVRKEKKYAIKTAFVRV